MSLDVTSPGATMPGLQGNSMSGQPQFGQSIGMGGEPAWQQVANDAYAAAAETPRDVYFAQARDAAKKHPTTVSQPVTFAGNQRTYTTPHGDTACFSCSTGTQT